MSKKIEGLASLENRFQKAYWRLREEFGFGFFRSEQARDILNNLGFQNINEVFSELRQAGILEAKKDKKDKRERIYKLIEIENESVALTQDQIIKLLKTGADLIRTRVDYKILLVFLFYKAISDKWNIKAEEAKKKVKNNRQAYILANTGYYKLYDAKANKLYTWQEVTKSKNIIADLANALRAVAQMNRERFGELEKVLEVLGLFGFISQDNQHIIEGLVSLFDNVDFTKAKSDALGDAYMWILSYFAPDKAKEGEVFTAREVIDLMVKLLDIKEGSTVLDPACGSGSMLIESYRYVCDKNTKNKPNIELYGQEANEIMEALAKLNFILHDIDNFHLWMGDSLKNPRFPECDYLIANPPWNAKGYGQNTFTKVPAEVRQIYTSFLPDGFPANSSADWAWVQLMLYKARRKVAVLLDSGALFRGGRERAIRKAILEQDLIEVVILLPEKFFYNTQAPGIILVLNKNKDNKKRNKVLFINASEEYDKHPNVRKLNILPKRAIKKIVEHYHSFKELEHFARIVDLEKIKENDYNLNVSLYVAPKVEEEEIDLKEELKAIKELKQKEKDLEAEVMDILEKIIKLDL